MSLAVAAACTLSLVLLVDSSGSIRDPEFEVQRDAAADAVASREIVRIVERRGGVAVAVVMFSEAPRTVVPWTVIRDAAAAGRFADRLRGVERPFRGGTNTGRGLGHSLDELATAPCREEMVVDVSTDGVADDPAVLADQRARAVAEGVRINALGVVSPIDDHGGASHEDAVERAQEWMDGSLRTPDGFVIVVRDWSDYHRAIRRKLALEISVSPTPSSSAKQ